MEIDILSHFYAWWFDFLLIGYWSIIYQGAMIIVFMIAAINIDDSKGITKLDAWLDFTIVTVMAGVTSTFQILYNEPIQFWYYGALSTDPDK